MQKSWAVRNLHSCVHSRPQCDGDRTLVSGKVGAVLRTRRALVEMGALVILALALVPIGVAAQTTTPGAGTAGGGTTINVFCLDFGKKFPDGQSVKAQGLADDKVRGALQYALGKGYVQSNPYEVQLAVWNITDGQPFHDVNNRGTTIAQEIVSNAGSAPAGSASDVSNITVSNLKAADANAAYGTGTVTGSLPANVPVGFLLPASDGTFQRLVSVVASTTGQASTGAQATTAPTTTGAATTASGTTSAAGSAAASTTTTTGTTAAGTTAATTAPTATTASSATTAPTATTAATSAATTAPTATAATATRAATTAPLATGTGGATVATQAPTTLPATGAARNDGSSDFRLLAVLLLTLGVIATGIVLRRRAAQP